MRRVDCRACGVRVEELPWASGKHQLTKAYMLFLAHWARKLSWQETAVAFRTSWDKVCQAVEYVVAWGLEHRHLGAIQAIGVDEIQYAKGHKYLTLVYQMGQGCIRLLWIGKDRTTYEANRTRITANTHPRPHQPSGGAVRERVAARRRRVRTLRPQVAHPLHGSHGFRRLSLCRQDHHKWPRCLLPQHRRGASRPGRGASCPCCAGTTWYRGFARCGRAA